MFTKISTVVVAALVASAAAAPWGAAQCNTSDIQCCNQVFEQESESYTDLTALLGIAVQDAGAAIGVQCSPIDVIGAGSGASCTAQPVCCANNSFNGVVSLGCSPINASA